VSAVLALLAVLLAAPLQQQPAGPGDDAATKLVQRIQQDLSEVDRLLEQASDVSEPAGELSAARKAHVRAIADLEELIRQVKYRRSGKPDSGGGGGSSSQPSPRDADDRGQAGSAPAPQDQQAGKPEQKKDGQDQGGQKPQASPRQDAGAGQQRDASAMPPPDALDDFLRRDTDARWGVLPPKMQERLMNLHVDDVPERYRTWLDAYVRELMLREAGASRP
jgi:hypothetical protein